MKSFMAKIWVPALLVMTAAAQSFGIDASRAIRMRMPVDSLVLNMVEDTAFAENAVDSLHTPDTLRVLTAKDTITAPDSLKEKDPFFYKYYLAVKDSATRAAVRDSLIQAKDTLELHKFDSLYVKDSTEVAKAEFDAWYASLSRRERRKYDAEQALPGLMAEARRKIEIRDSIKARRDSIRESIPRVLETFAFPDSMQFKRIVTWKHDKDFHDMIDLRDQWPDTSYNVNFYDYAFMKKDLGATWLGVAGSPVQLYNYFKREENQDAIFFTPYQTWGYTPESMPQYNTKTPYVELAYWGTLFANQEKEEANVKVLVTQNITPDSNTPTSEETVCSDARIPNTGQPSQPPTMWARNT